MKLETVLVTTDLSETSAKAFGPARALAERFGAEIRVVLVEEDRLPPALLEYMTVDLEQILQLQADQARTRLRTFVEDRLGPDVEARLVIATGPPHIEILRLARSCHADLIVMATHGRGLISRTILGSTTERVVRRSACPVLVIPVHGDDHDERA